MKYLMFVFILVFHVLISVISEVSIVSPLPDQYFEISTPLSIELLPTNYKSDDDALIRLELSTSYPSWINISENQIRPIRSFGYSGGSEDFFMHNNIAYICDGLYGLKIVDYSDVYNPELITVVQIVVVSGVYVNDDYIYVADSVSGLFILEHENFKVLSMTNMGPAEQGMNDVYVEDDIAYISNGPHGLCIIDVSNPYSPSVISSYDTDNGKSVFFDDYIAYIADEESGIVAINLTDMTDPNVYGEYDPDNAGSNAYDVVIVKKDGSKYAFVALWEAGLVIIDVEKVPFTVHSSLDTCQLKGIYVSESGNTTYAACGNDGFEIYDTSNISDPKVLSSERIDYIGNYYHTVWVNETLEIAYLSGKKLYDEANDNIYDIVCFNVSDLENPEIIMFGDSSDEDNVVFLGSTYTIEISDDGEIAYLADAESGLTMYNLSGGIHEKPRYIGRYYSSFYLDYYYSVDVDISTPEAMTGNQYLCVAAGLWGVEILNITAPEYKTSPEYVTEIKPEDPVPTFTYRCSYVYDEGEDRYYVYAITTMYNNFFYIINVTDLESSDAVIVSMIELPSSPYQMLVHNEYVYIGTSNIDQGLMILDVRDRSHPFVCGDHPTVDQVYGIHVQDDIAYLGEIGRLGIYDVSDKTDPVLLNQINEVSFFVEAIQHILFVSDFFFKKIMMLDISNLVDPIILHTLENLVEGCGDLKARGNILYSTPGLYRYVHGGILLEADVPDNICGSIDDAVVDVVVIGSEISENPTLVMQDSYNIYFTNCDDVSLECNGETEMSSICGGYGNCTNNIYFPDPWCECLEGESYGSNCDIFQCGGVFSNDTEQVCSGHGDCGEPNGLCSCFDGYEIQHSDDEQKCLASYAGIEEKILEDEFLVTYEGVFVIIIGTSIIFFLSSVLFLLTCCICEIFCGGKCLGWAKAILGWAKEMVEQRRRSRRLLDDSKDDIDLLDELREFEEEDVYNY